MPKSTPHLAAPPIESEAPRPALPAPVFHDAKHHIKIFQGDCLDILAAIPASCVDLIFADPPYFLSNNGITCHAGRMVSVNKGQWDKLPGADLDPVRDRFDKVHEFNRAWLSACQRVLKPNGTIWVSGTSHVLHFDLDPSLRSVDRSLRTPTRPMDSSPSGKLVRRDRNFFFVGAQRREVVYSVSAENMEEALQKFYSSPHSAIEIIFVIKTETEIYLHQGK